MLGAPASAGLLLAALILLVTSGLASAAEPEAIEVQTGYSESDIEAPQDHYQTVPLHASYWYSAEPWLEKVLGSRPDGTWQYCIEPFIDPTISPGTSAEIGFHLGFKLSTPVDGSDGNWRAFLRGGTGPMLTFQDTLEESTKFQFGSYFGGGLSYALDENSALTLELRQRHMSNASIKRPNSGVNGNYVMLGYYWQLED
ncbi:acyloxyacyl hydrolase [bacterium]|nr:acyloxyacyl hydrolase [bacterium]